MNNDLRPNNLRICKFRCFHSPKRPERFISGLFSEQPALREMSTGPTHAPSPTIPYTSPPVTVILTIILLLFFFVGFCSIYFCRCFMHNLFYTWQQRQNPSRTPTGRGGDRLHHGLDHLIIRSFPTFTYSSVKEYRKENYGLECAICLSEFKDESVLRLLTKCCHVFHQDCIDLWLASHKSCPCCRCSLDMPYDSPEKSPTSVINSSANSIHDGRENNDSHGDSIAIDINENRENIEDKCETKKDQKHVVIDVGQDRREDNLKTTRDQGFTRSKSTGHAIVRNFRGRENDEKFMLRLPHDVQAKLIPRHNWTRSCTEFGEYKSKTSSSHTGFDKVTLDKDGHKT
uniref:RING-H2 finger protein ATL29-like n=1 Tax=Erigeron canadensis TaxID=72917 RepID=UPI001CB8F1D2|nr:RING-H2 finger protein ATL29-like [Erigeron canadensis]